MIKKSGLALLGILSYSILESLIFGYDYFIVFTFILFFIVSSDIIIFNRVTTQALERIRTDRDIGQDFTRKYQGKEVKLKFRNPNRNLVKFHYYDTISDNFTVEGDFEGEISLAPGEEKTVTYVLKPLSIGKYEIGPLKLYSEDPMKLCVENVEIEKADTVRVGPSMSDVFTQRSERLSNFLFTVGIHFSRKSGQGYDFYGIRQYVESDDFRYVAWNRYGAINGDDLYIKQMEEERQIDVYFVVDYSINVNVGYGGTRMYDRVISTIINSAYSILKNRDRVGFQLISTDVDVFIPARKSDEGIKSLEKHVADLRPKGQFDISTVMKTIRKNFKKNSVVFIISPFSEPEHFMISNRKQFNTGHPTYLFIPDRYDFEPPTTTEVGRKLLMSLEIKQRKNLKAITSFFNGVGIKAVVARDRELIARILAEYRYARTLNLGS